MGVTYTAAYVVSDLHIGGKPGKQMFSAGKSFEQLCDIVIANRQSNDPTLFLINGDFVDFLAESDATYWNPATAADSLRAIAKRKSFAPVFSGLRKLVGAGVQLVITLGNHDLELTLPDVKEAFLELTCGTSSSKRRRVQFEFDYDGYRFNVGGAKALAVHGNHVDPWNFTPFSELYQEIRKAQSGGNPSVWVPSIGTQLVVEIMNPIKSRFPFVDVLKPERAVVAALGALDPTYFRYAADLIYKKAKATYNFQNRASSDRKTLSAVGAATDTLVVNSREVEVFANELMKNRPDQVDDYIYDLSDDTLGLSEWASAIRDSFVDFAEAATAKAQQIGQHVADTLEDQLRSRLRAFISTRGTNDLSKMDTDLLQSVSPDHAYHVVFAGHTHEGKLHHYNKRDVWYVNTATWAGLMELTEADVMTDDGIQRLKATLNSRDRKVLRDHPAFRRDCPVATLKVGGSGNVNLKLRRVRNGKLVNQVPTKSISL